MEEIRKVEGYLISNDGWCYNANVGIHQNYYRITDGSGKLIHILVAKAFPEVCGEWFEGCVVHHINHNSLDNRAINLKVCSRQEHFEIHRADNTGKRKEKYKDNEPWYKIAANKKENGTEHNTNKWCNIAKCDMDGNILEIYPTAYEAGIKNNIDSHTIRRCLQGKQKTSGNYKWMKV